MTWGNPPKFKSNPSKPGKKITPEDLAKSGTEDGHQAAVFCWSASMWAQYPQLKWLHAIPNGGSRHIAEATKMVAAGTRSGVWDIFLPAPMRQRYDSVAPDGSWHGLYIEMKELERRNHKNGGLSEDQITFGRYAEEMGYFCAVCYTWEEARDVILKYLEGKI